jgi:ribosome-associated toxin RatA of RatAB toxin-antitoxin module
MRHVKNLFAAVALVGLMAGFAPPTLARPAFDALTEDEVVRVDRGEIVVNVEKSDSAVKHFRVVGQVQASAARTYRVFTDFARYDEIFYVKDSKILSATGNTMHVRATIVVPWPIGSKWVTNETVLSPDDYSFSFQRIDGSIIAYSGNVRIVPRDTERCDVYYVAKADPGIPFLPAWLLNQFQASMLPDTIKHVRAYLKRQAG